jgi:hypothetical protein
MNKKKKSAIPKLTKTDNQENKKIHSSGLNVIQNPDGSFVFEWNPEDPRWDWMNELSDEEITKVIETLVMAEKELFDKNS